MKEREVVVIGGGFSGLISAIKSARSGKRTALLQYGSGAFPLNSGLIDILGYDQDKKEVENPLEAIADLPKAHPYHRIGKDMVEKSADFFLGLMEEQGFPYEGSVTAHRHVATAIGTWKPSSLVPPSMDLPPLAGKRLIVVDVKGLKDFDGKMAAANLTDRVDSVVESTRIELGPIEGRDITLLSCARFMEAGGWQKAVEALRPLDGENVVFLFPQVLGIQGNTVYRALDKALKGAVVETTGMPPSANGMRLRDVLLRAARGAGVELVENAQVTGAEIEGKECKYIRVQAGVHEQHYHAEKYILATGGFYSGGLYMEDLEKPREVVFGLPVSFDKEHWTDKDFFAEQGFMLAGIDTDESLRPVDETGAVVLENVRVVGRNLSGYDFCREHSGNGVALSSAYKAAMV